MEIVLIACMLAWAAGAQSEQSKLGLSPATRAAMREQTRHEKAIQKIAERYGDNRIAPTGPGAIAPSEKTAAPPAATIPEAFRAGYRGHSPVARVTTPMGRRVGGWTAQGVTWASDTGRGAVREYRKRRQDAGHDDPAPVLAPVPTGRPQIVPPMPTEPPTVGAHTDDEALTKPDENPEPAKPDEAPTQTPINNEKTSTAPEPSTGDLGPARGAGDTTEPTPETPANPQGGAGRMAAEVTYESVMDESDELSLMCGDDARIYDRIRARAEREVGRGDDLIVALHNAGFGAGIVGWVTRCMDQYRMIRAQVDDLQANTIAQGEKVVVAKALLEAGQGVYAEIAKDMESVAERGSYISDAVDTEDTSAHTEIYETKAA